MRTYSIMPPLLLTTGHCVVSLYGEIDLAAASQFYAALTQAVSMAHAGVVVDLGGLTFIDASGLGVLIQAHQDCDHLPDGIRLVAASRWVTRLLAVSQLDGYLNCFPTLRSATRGGGGSSGGGSSTR